MKDLEKLLMDDWFGPASHRGQLVHHYTNAAGLIGILRSNNLRGTNAAFLNDTTEIAYGTSFCKTEIESMLNQGLDRERLLEHVSQLYDFSSMPAEVFITAFTTAEDSLGHWRGYGSEAGRYCLSFQVSGFSERDVLRLPQPVDYDPESQRNRVRRALDLALNHLSRTGGDRRSFFEVATTLGLYLHRLACVFKHPGFQEEKEWRSVTSFKELGVPYPLDFDIRGGMPYPYLAMLTGSRLTTHLPLVEVRVGPMKKQEAAVHATRLLLQSLGYDNVGVSKALVPLAT